MSHDLSWDARDVRAWDAATALETLLDRAHGLLSEGAPSEEQIARGVRACVESAEVPTGMLAHLVNPEGVPVIRERVDLWTVVEVILTAVGVAPQGATAVGGSPELPTETPESGSVASLAVTDESDGEVRASDEQVSAPQDFGESATVAASPKAGKGASSDRAKLIAEAENRTVAHARQNPEGSIDLERRLAKALATPPQGDYHEGLEEGIKIGRAEMKLDPKKVAEVLDEHEYMYSQYGCRCGWIGPGSHQLHQGAVLCEAYTEGELHA